MYAGGGGGVSGGGVGVGEAIDAPPLFYMYGHTTS